MVESGRAEHSGGQREKVKKRKLDVHECSKNDVVVEETDKENQAEKNLKKVKSVSNPPTRASLAIAGAVAAKAEFNSLFTRQLAVSMAAKSASLARELKSIKSDLCFMREQCTLLEEENRRLRDGFCKDIRPDEDDLVTMCRKILFSCHHKFSL